MVVILMSDEFLSLGLAQVGFDHYHQDSVKHKTKIECLKSYFGSQPDVNAQIREDLQMMTVP